MKHSKFAVAIAAAVSCLAQVAAARDFFAHYLVGTVTQEHAQTDIDFAKSLGIDGFALNIGDPTQEFVKDALGFLFSYAASVGGFKLYISMDLYALGNSFFSAGYKNPPGKGCGVNNPGPAEYFPLFQQYLGHPAYHTAGPHNFPMISTFSSGGCTNDTFIAWKETLANQMYFVPNFDDAEGYYEGAQSTWDYWGPPISDGFFSWDSVWPVVGAKNDGDITRDLTVQAACIKNDMSYMMGLSFLQYKNSYGANLYRRGEQNMPIRMENILKMETLPDHIEWLTWNDGPESHYMGNLWWEQNNDTQPARYATQVGADHSGLQPIIAGFIAAYKAGVTADKMPTPFGLQGVLYYKTIFQDTTCPFDGEGQYFNKPNGSQAGTDQVNWMIVVPENADGDFQYFVTSNGKAVDLDILHAGLNYGQGSVNVQEGTQNMVILDLAEDVFMYTSAGRLMTHACTDDIYNFNPQVLPLVPGTPPPGYESDGWQVSGVPIFDKADQAIIGLTYGPLSSTSSCTDLENTDAQLTSDMYNALDAGSELASWLSLYQGDSWLSDLAQPLGIQQSFGTCSVESVCTRPNCQDIDTVSQSASGTGWEYAVIVSAVNLNIYLSTIWKAVDSAVTMFNTEQIGFVSTFGSEAPTNFALTQQILNGIGTAIGIVVAGGAIEEPVIGILGPLVSGIFGALIGLLPTEPEFEQFISSDEMAAGLAEDWATSISTAIDDANTALLGPGTYSGGGTTVNVQDLLANGLFLDFRNFPIIDPPADDSTDADTVANNLFQTLSAMLVNMYWKEENAFLACYPMSQDTFDSTVVKAGTNDPRLKNWVQDASGNGFGCYFQTALVDEGAGAPSGKVINPTGWGSLANTPFTFTTNDIIIGSWQSFQAGGFNYQVSTTNEFVTNVLTDAENIGNLFTLPGLFTIPICMAPAGKYTDLEQPDSHTQYPSWCDCYNVPDMNGVTIEQAIPYIETLYSYQGRGYFPRCLKDAVSPEP